MLARDQGGFGARTARTSSLGSGALIAAPFLVATVAGLGFVVRGRPQVLRTRWMASATATPVEFCATAALTAIHLQPPGEGCGLATRGSISSHRGRLHHRLLPDATERIRTAELTVADRGHRQLVAPDPAGLPVAYNRDPEDRNPSSTPPYRPLRRLAADMLANTVKTDVCRAARAIPTARHRLTDYLVRKACRSWAHHVIGAIVALARLPPALATVTLSEFHGVSIVHGCHRRV
jgi:hypothetical protein